MVGHVMQRKPLRIDTLRKPVSCPNARVDQPDFLP